MFTLFNCISLSLLIAGVLGDIHENAVSILDSILSSTMKKTLSIRHYSVKNLKNPRSQGSSLRTADAYAPGYVFAGFYSDSSTCSGMPLISGSVYLSSCVPVDSSFNQILIDPSNLFLCNIY